MEEIIILFKNGMEKCYKSTAHNSGDERYFIIKSKDNKYLIPHSEIYTIRIAAKNG